MANNNISKRIYYRMGCNGNKPEDKPSGFDPYYGSEGDNLLIFPRDRITPWQEDDNETRKRKEIRVASFDPVLDPMVEAFQYWSDYKASHPQGHRFKNLSDFISYVTATEDYDHNYKRGGLAKKTPPEKEGVMQVVSDPSNWQKKYLRNFGYDENYLDNLKRDDLERLFEDIMTRRALRGRA